MSLRRFAALLAAVAALSPPPSIAFADPGADFSRGLLWRLEKPGVAPSHVFGTIHSTDPRVTRLPDAVREALAASDSYTMEIRLDDMARRLFAEAMFIEGPRKLAALVGAETFEAAAKRMQAVGVPPEVTARLKPWAVLINLVVPEEVGGVILDDELFHQAMLQHKPVYQLETVEEQIALFDDIPLETQVALLRDALDRFDLMAGLIAGTLDAYLAGDLAEISRINSALVAGAGPAAPHHEYFVRRVVHGRSIIMAHRMQARLREGRAFFAVGALHLYGPQGLLNLLSVEGYRVTRVY